MLERLQRVFGQVTHRLVSAATDISLCIKISEAAIRCFTQLKQGTECGDQSMQIFEGVIHEMF